MIDLLYNRTVKGIPLFSVSTLLDDSDTHMFKAGSLFIKYQEKIIPLGCIKDIYADPNTGKKVSVPNISNSCINVKSAFNISCSSQDCIACHKIASNMAFKNEIKLLKK